MGVGSNIFRFQHLCNFTTVMENKIIVQEIGLNIYAPLEPIPDNDWVGETWGLFWPDLEEFEELKENPEKFLKKHYEDKSKVEWHPPPNLTAKTSSVDVLTAPKPEKP